MQAQVIRDYQAWADRGYVQALTCERHPYHDLLVLQVVDSVVLTCPRGDYRRELGLADYRALERKAIMASLLHRM
jgi:hypothetical protein